MFSCCSSPKVRDDGQESTSTPSAGSPLTQRPNGVAEEMLRRPGLGRGLAGGADDKTGPSSRWDGSSSKAAGTRGNQVVPLQSLLPPPELLSLNPQRAGRGQSHIVDLLEPYNASTSSGPSLHPFAVGGGRGTSAIISQPSISAGQLLRDFSGSELAELGFPVFSAAGLRDLPHAGTQPLAFLGIEPSSEGKGGHRDEVDVDAEGLPGGASIGAGHGLPHGRAKPVFKLVPLHINSVCRSYFSLANHKEYAPVVRKLLKKDPLLTFAIQKSLRYLRAGECQPVSHVTPDPSGQTSSLFGMRITPCVWAEELGPGQISLRLHPALLVEHNAPYNPAEVMPRLMRDYAVLSHVPAILTLIDFQVRHVSVFETCHCCISTSSQEGSSQQAVYESLDGGFMPASVATHRWQRLGSSQAACSWQRAFQ
jgi:hypothetical protein